MSGDDLMPYGRLRSVMTPLDMAWSVLKADPRMQAFEAGGYHPEISAGTLPGGVVRNLGTVDPNVMAMAMRQLGPGGSEPQENMSRIMRGRDNDDRTYTIPLQAQGSNPYEAADDGDGFKGLGASGDDYFGVPRQPRPEAFPQKPPARSSQHIIDSFMGDGSPLTPQDGVELASRLRSNDEHRQRRAFAENRFDAVSSGPYPSTEPFGYVHRDR